MFYYTTVQIGLIKNRIKSTEISGVHGPCNADCCLLGLTWCSLEGCYWHCRQNCFVFLHGWSILSCTMTSEQARSSETFKPTNQTRRQEMRRLKSTACLLLVIFSRVAGITFVERRWTEFLKHTHTILITILIRTGTLSQLNINSEDS
jgi:hypothetical protein